MEVLTKEKCPAGIKPLKSIYVLTKKLTPDGSIEKYKARRVVQGFHQVLGKDFFETFSPVVGFDTIRLVIKLAVEKKWDMRTIDFTQAYLNAPLRETIYVKNKDGSIERLNKALYGLKQAGHEWNRALNIHILKRKEWKQSEFDNCLFYAYNEASQKIGIIAVYVDDLLITGSWTEEIELIQDHLLNKFKGKINEDPKTYLQMEIKRDGEDVVLHQSGYCRSIVKMIFPDEVRPVYVPLEPGADLSSRREDEDTLDLTKHPYRTILGKLMYLAHMSRPDISNAVRELGQQMHDPTMRHWKSLIHLLRYLSVFCEYGVPFKRQGQDQNIHLKGYSDADFASDTETRRSCAGYLIMFGSTVISWSSKTERNIVLNTTESEWTALARGIKHRNFLRGLLEELGFRQPTTLWFCDNQATIISARTVGFNGRTRHVDVKLKFTRQECERGHIELQYVPTDRQLADGLTKRLRRIKHEQMVNALLHSTR